MRGVGLGLRAEHEPAWLGGEACEVPFAEVACLKDYPGTWAEYRIFEGGVLQVHRRLSTPEALAWSERCRAMYHGAYPWYAFGEVGDRCFALPDRPSGT